MIIFGWEITIARAGERAAAKMWVRLLEQERAQALAALNRADIQFHLGNLDLARGEVATALTALTVPDRVKSYGGTD